MASECACFGTPAIYVNSLKLGYIKEEERYGLVFDLNDDDVIIEEASRLIQGHSKGEWQEKKNRFINEKIDLTKHMIDLILEFNPQN